MAVERCACGEPLHYTSAAVEADVRRLVALHGEYTTVVVSSGSYRVQRHYIALHGLKADEVPSLGFERVDG